MTIDHYRQAPKGLERVRIFDADGSSLEAIYFLTPTEVVIGLDQKLILPKVAGAEEFAAWETVTKFKKVLGRGPDA